MLVRLSLIIGRMSSSISSFQISVLSRIFLGVLPAWNMLAVILVVEVLYVLHRFLVVKRRWAQVFGLLLARVLL